MSEIKTKISVIVPVYNTKPEYIFECIKSIKEQTFKEYEIIVVNDGSTDKNTLDYLDKLQEDGIQVIHQVNQGLSAARNTGIKNSKGVYILPLDSDDKISSTYLAQANNFLDKHPEYGVVYSKARYFGAIDDIFFQEEFDADRIKYNSMVFCSSIYRKTLWDLCGGYKTDMIYGFEDWDLYLSFVENKVKFYRLEDTCFFYRQHSTPSMLKKLVSDNSKHKYSLLKLVYHHIGLYDDFEELYRFLFLPKIQIRKNSFIENIFSIKNLSSVDKKHKIVTILGIKMKFKINKTRKG